VVNAGASLVFLPDWHALIPECVATLQEREDALASVQLLSEQLHEKQDTAARLAAGFGAAADADKRMVALAASVHALQVRPCCRHVQSLGWETVQGVSGGEVMAGPVAG
jgi:hypothetical protein